MISLQLKPECFSDQASAVFIHLINPVFIITVKLCNIYLKREDYECYSLMNTIGSSVEYVKNKSAAGLTGECRAGTGVSHLWEGRGSAVTLVSEASSLPKMRCSRTCAHSVWESTFAAWRVQSEPAATCRVMRLTVMFSSLDGPVLLAVHVRVNFALGLDCSHHVGESVLPFNQG